MTARRNALPTPAQAQARQKLRTTIHESGLGVPSFARHVMARNARTLERWLAGDSPISPVVQDWLENAHVRCVGGVVCTIVVGVGPRRPQS